MPYPRQIIAMGQNLLKELETNPNLHETRFYMLWDAILHYHFPLHLDYGVVPQTLIASTATKSEFLVRIARESEHIIVVVKLKKSASETQAAMEKLVQELVDYIEECFSETGYPTIYGIGGIGFSWTALKMEKAGSRQPTTLVPWHGNVVSNQSASLLKAVVDEIHTMTRQVISPSTSNNPNSS